MVGFVPWLPSYRWEFVSTKPTNTAQNKINSTVLPMVEKAAQSRTSPSTMSEKYILNTLAQMLCTPPFLLLVSSSIHSPTRLPQSSGGTIEYEISLRLEFSYSNPTWTTCCWTDPAQQGSWRLKTHFDWSTVPSPWDCLWWRGSRSLPILWTNS